MAVASSEQIDWNCEELVVNPTCVEGKDTHHENQVSHLVNVWQQFLGSLTL